MLDSRSVLRRSLFLPVLALLLAVALVPQAALAQDDGGGDDARHDGRHALQVVIRTLQLDEAQVAQWAEIRQNAAAAVEPLATQLQDLQAQLEAVLNGDAPPDPETVGSLVLAIRDVRQQIQAIGQGATEAFEALLSETQAGRLNAVRRAARLQRLLPAFRAFRLL